MGSHPDRPQGLEGGLKIWSWMVGVCVNVVSGASQLLSCPATLPGAALAQGTGIGGAAGVPGTTAAAAAAAAGPSARLIVAA